MRVHALDVLDPLTGESGETEPDRHHDLAADHEVVLDQEVVVLADRAVDHVLDRDDARVGLAVGHGPEHRPEAAHARARHVTESGKDRVLGERTGFAGEHDGETGHARV